MRTTRGILCLLGFALASSAKYGVEYQREPIQLSPPNCECPPIYRRSAGPAVGLALDIGYGTVSTTYGNSTGADVAKIKGSSRYVGLMERLATGPIERMSDGSRVPQGVDQHDISTRPIWIWYKLKYWVRKLLSLPATPEIGILADMVAQLRREAEAVLGRQVKHVALSSPDRVRLTVYEIRDILDYLGMESVITEQVTGIDQLFNMAATAAMSDIGDGLCNSFANLTECARWDSHLINEWALQLDYSNRSLSGAMDERGTARRGWAPATFVDLALGADHRPIRESDDDNNDGEQYWDRLEARVRDFIEANHPPQRLYLTGERAADRRFLTAVRNALGGPNARLPFSVENSLGLAWLKIFGGGLPII